MRKRINTLELTAILKKLKTFHGNVYSPDEFKALVKYERTRCDRNGSIFSITVFRLENGKSIDLESFLRRTAGKARSIDCLGWSEDDEKIEVLLPDTDKEGAEFFGQKVRNEYNAPSDIGFDVYTYPDHWRGKESGDPEELRKSERGSATSLVESLFVLRMPLWKRILDVSGSLLLLLLTSPIFLLLSVYIKIISPGPVFFKQIRVGYKGIPFRFWKFRTMKIDNNQEFHGAYAQTFIKSGDIPMLKLDKKDPRIFFGGRAVRRSCIDELPQLWNVLRGDMSLVGPRPCIPYEAKEYLRWHTHRFDTVPGLSGLWQVSGKNKLTFNQMIRLDIKYCQNMSLLKDLFIIAKTPYAILKMILESVWNKLGERGSAISSEKKILAMPEQTQHSELSEAVASFDR